jgi:hypothetical protein
MLILAHSFRGFGPWLVGSIAFGPVVRQKHCGGECVVKQRYSLHGIWEAKRKRSQGSYTSRAHSQWPNFLPLGLPPKGSTTSK